MSIAEKSVLFYSYKPFLQISLRNIEKAYCFNADCKCLVTGERKINALRSYAEIHKNSYIVVECGSGITLQELQSLHDEMERKLIDEAEEREQERIKQRLKQKERHELFSLLRM